MKPSDIPDDIWKAAAERVAAIRVFTGEAAMTEIVARAMQASALAERELCAAVATSLADDIQTSADELRGNMRNYRLHRAAGIRHLVDILRKPEAYDERLQSVRSRP